MFAACNEFSVLCQIYLTNLFEEMQGFKAVDLMLIPVACLGSVPVPQSVNGEIAPASGDSRVFLLFKKLELC